MFSCICLFFIACFAAHGQTRGSIPEELLHPGRGESSRYPADTVIGELGQGKAPAAAYSYANSLAEGLFSGQMGNSALASINPSLREKYLTALGSISPRSYRLGGGREEADGAVSFIIRFIGREYGITGEMYLRYARQTGSGETSQTGNWMFDELLLEEAKSREVEEQEAAKLRHRLDLLPYERFF
ncbi:MAG: hypothetical protein LBQ93_00755 [Treponema sp.]|jgi:hypothetical protein|nr:hypothetical protein [Treponema sp.]